MIKANNEEAVYFQNKSAATQILVKENLLSNLKKIKNSIEDGKTIRKKKRKLLHQSGYTSLRQQHI